MDQEFFYVRFSYLIGSGVEIYLQLIYVFGVLVGSCFVIVLKFQAFCFYICYFDYGGDIYFFSQVSLVGFNSFFFVDQCCMGGGQFYIVYVGRVEVGV